MLDKNKILGLIFLGVGSLFMIISLIVVGEEVLRIMPERELVIETLEGDFDDLQIIDSKVPIFIEPSEDGKVHIERFESESEFYSVSSNNDIVIREIEKKKLSEKFSFPSIVKDEYYLKVKIPDGFDIEILADENDVYINNVSTNYINVNSLDGELHINNVDNNTITNLIVYGDVYIDELNTNYFYLISDENNLYLDKINTKHSFSINNNNGIVNVSNCISAKDLDIDSYNGSIVMNNVDFKNGNISALKGSIYMNLVGDYEEYTYDFYSNKDVHSKKGIDNGRFLKCTTNSGNIVIECGDKRYSN